MKELHVGKNDAGRRLDRVVHAAFPALPTTGVIRALRTKNIRVNGKKADPDYRVAEGDTVSLRLPDELLIKGEARLPRELPPPEIIYEDAHILLADKPAGLVVHEDDRGSTDTLIGRILSYLVSTQQYDPEKENTFVPALVNRIDRNTCGIVIAAKDAESLRILSEKIKNREIDKKYLCAVAGRPEPASGLLTHYLLKDERKKEVTLFDRPRTGALTAKTRYKTLSARGNISLVKATLLTGRTHQIRVQMASVGHPLIGDGKYGDYALNKMFRMNGQALCSYELTFSFSSPAGILEYLNKKTFRARSVPFLLPLGFSEEDIGE